MVYIFLLFSSILQRNDTQLIFNPLSTSPTKWSKTLKQFVSSLLTNFLSVFDHSVGFALKGLNQYSSANANSRSSYHREKVFLKISLILKESTCVRVSFLIKLQAAPATLLNKKPWHRCFLANLSNFFKKRALFLQNTSKRLYLKFKFNFRLTLPAPIPDIEKKLT